MQSKQAHPICEHAYTLAQNLDPNSEGRGVLQFKTGLMSIIKIILQLSGHTESELPVKHTKPLPFPMQKLAKKEGGVTDRSQDISRLRDFYKLYREKNNVDKLREEEMELRESGTVLEQLTKELSPEEAEGLIPEEVYIIGHLKRVIESDAAMTEDLIAYNIIPLDAPAITNAITSFPEVRAAISSLKYYRGLPKLPANFPIPATRSADILDFLHYVFGFQKGNVSNQRENIVNLLSNEQSRLGIPDDHEPKLDETAVERVFLKSLDNYIKWCTYLDIPLMWSNLDLSKEKKILFISLYFLIWGEAANIRYLPECLCYIFHRFNQQMGEELDELLRQQLAKPADSCVTENGVSFLEQVICPLYDVIAAEAANNNDGKEPHSTWRNYDDFNEVTLTLLFPGPLVALNFFGHSIGIRLSFGSQHQGQRCVGHCGDVWCLFYNKALGCFEDFRSFHLIYLLDIHIFYTIISAVVGFLLGARDRLGEIRSLGAVHKLFEKFPEAFMDNLHIPLANRDTLRITGQKNKFDAARFSPFWNEIVKNLREEDYITNLEMELLLMPTNSGTVPMVQWPLFLLASKIFLAKDIAGESDSQEELWDRISRDDYMKYAVEECFYTIKLILTSILADDDGKLWVERIYEDIRGSMVKRSIHIDFQLKKLALVIQKVTALTGILKEVGTPELESGAVNAALDLYDVIQLDFFNVNMRENYATWNMLLKARKEGRLFSKLKWPRDPELRSQIRRLHSLFTIKDSAVNVPKNLEARRRLQFFTNSLFMSMPRTKPVREMLSFSVFTPYYSETVLYSMKELLKKNEDGISILFYLQKIYPDEWKNFLARIGRDENTHEADLIDNDDENLELRFWASYRGQTLARTVRGMMYYRKALMLQAYLERMTVGDIEAAVPTTEATDIKGFEFSPEARAHADLKFTYVVTCQIYGRQKEEQKPEAADIALLLQRNEALRVAFIDEVETLTDGKVHKEFYSKLVKGDINGKDKEVYSIKLPGNPKLGEGKPENQNHAIVFTRGNAVQTIDMNQDNYFEEALKMRNLLEEFHAYHGIRPATILGVREHVFTGSVSSLASFMSNQETSFVTLGQRVLASPLKVRMHYGHPDVFDRVFHITRGGISKASRVINISEDIYAGFNSTLRQGNITHHEYIQALYLLYTPFPPEIKTQRSFCLVSKEVGKGRDVGLNQIALFEGKVAGGNGEQVLSRDIYRLGQLFDFFRMLSFYFTTVGYYFCTMLTVITVYIFLYGKTYLALSGVGEDIQTRADVLHNTALNTALNTQFLFQIGVFTAIPMVLGFILEQGFFRAVVSFITMQFQLCTVFFTFSLGTRTHYFGRTILHGGAKYHATGRGFVVRHIKFSENYRLYSRSHFVKGMEVVLLLVVFVSYGFNEAGAVGYILLSVSSWFMAISWLFAPYMFNPSGFEWQKTVEDFRDWTNWLFYRGGIGVKGEESWEAWWDEELSHIRTLGGRVMETILSLRFFIFQYGVIYKLDVQGSKTSLSIFTFSQKISVNFQLILRFVQGVAFMLALAGIAVAVAITDLTITDIFASILAFVPTGWGLLSICVAWRPVLKKIGLWKSVRSLGRLYDAGMGMLIFIPIALCSWFPFISTFQTRLMFNQAFSRGLEISLILAGNNPNSGL
ncbi:1,3-beta-glucan synthase subunit FKS1-like, domain-1 [Cynara cardunculus var. scolymus]|uniref:1,3-beta-glucan synthase n=1 Tax=Cynara cardunculus var. scolymus TaxID=59895 RepID=A0A103XSP6_CYNCS|nr:1,3-beta-glucan synthase subunit FKS1-like, domain-1 [Cynara cardunculus var. scolymus]